MPRVKVDNRVRVQIENGVAQRHRSFFVVLGDKGRDAVVMLHHMLSKAMVSSRPSVLWCYKKELGFSSHRKKRMKQLQKKIRSGSVDLNKDDPFELFISATNIRYCYYNETQKILGSTYGMCVLQDFEALTPNLLARTVETVEGGGIVVLLLRTMTSLKQLKTLVMDVHSRYRTAAHQDVVARFNERFLLSLADCTTCMLISDELAVLPLSASSANVKPIPPKESSLSKAELELLETKKEMEDTQPVGSIVNCCKTLDQARAVLTFVEAIAEKTLRSIVALTAARGRGKSAALGLAIASAVGFDYSNIFVVSPSPENLKTLFEFVFKGLDAMHFQEHIDYELIQSTNPEYNKAIVRVNIFKGHRQTISYIHPSDAEKVHQAELVVIDEAAAIPLPLVKKLLGRHLVFMASTINGYEGTGRSLSLKLIKELRENASPMGSTSTSRVFREVTLEEPIRYGQDDPVEDWLHRLLCLNVSNVQCVTAAPSALDCELYYVNRDTLMCYHKVSEAFLQQLMSLYVSSHYKNTPNDLQLLSDAPAHHIFVLLPPQKPGVLPEILAVVQVCLEGEIAKEAISASLARGQRSAGDLIPWTVSQQFQESSFATLSGARVVRIATHPNFQKLGYGSRALDLLKKYYSGDIACVSEVPSTTPSTAATVDDLTIDDQTEVLAPRTNMPHLLWKLNERPPERLDYLGVSYGMTGQLYKFWRRSGYSPVYMRQTPNDLTGEHTCIMLQMLHADFSGSWLQKFNEDFRRRFITLLGYQFSSFVPATAISIMVDHKNDRKVAPLNTDEIGFSFTPYDIGRLEQYGNNLVDYHLIVDLVPKVAQLYFQQRMDINLSVTQMAILLGLGLQHKSVDKIAEEIQLSVGQLLGLFNRTVRKVVKDLIDIKSASIEKSLPTQARVIAMEPTAETVDETLVEAAEEIAAEQRQELEKLKSMDLSQYAITASEEAWDDALTGKTRTNGVSVKSNKKRKAEKIPEEDTQKRRKKQHGKNRRST